MGSRFAGRLRRERLRSKRVRAGKVESGMEAAVRGERRAIVADFGPIGAQFIIDYYNMQTRHPYPYLTSLHTYYLLILLY